MNSQYYVLSVCVSSTSTVTGELALCHLTVYSSYSIGTADRQAIQEVPLTLSPLALYIYGAPNKARKSNVVYIFGNAESPIFLLAAQCCNTE